MADDPVKTPEELNSEELQAAVAAARQVPAPDKPEEAPKPAAETKTFEYRGIDGTLYTADSQDDLFKKVAKARDDATLTIKDRERQIYELRHPAKPPETPAKNGNGFQKERYYQLLDQDPIEAQNYLDEYRLGTKNPRETIEKFEAREARTAQEENLRQEVMKFYATPTGQQFAKIETPELDQAMMTYMNEQGIERNALGFRTAFLEMKEAGRIPKQGKRPEREAPPPKSVGGGNELSGEEPNYDTMSTKDLQDAMERARASMMR